MLAIFLFTLMEEASPFPIEMNHKPSSDAMLKHNVLRMSWTTSNNIIYFIYLLTNGHSSILIIVIKVQTA